MENRVSRDLVKNVQVGLETRVTELLEREPACHLKLSRTLTPWTMGRRTKITSQLHHRTTVLRYQIPSHDTGV